MKTKKKVKAAETRRPSDRSKLRFNGEEYGKGRLVLAVVKQHVESNPGISYKELKKAFPDSLHALGIVRTIKDAMHASEKHRRFFVKDPIRVGNTTVAVCSDFGMNNIGKFLERAEELGYKIGK